MSGPEYMAANVIAPVRGHIAVVTSTVTEFIMTLSSTAHFGNDPADWKRQYISLQPDGGDVYFFLSTDGSAAPGGSINKLNTATKGPPDTRPWLVKDGQRFDFRLVQKINAAGVLAWTTKLWHEASAATKLRLYISSSVGGRDPNNSQ